VSISILFNYYQKGKGNFWIALDNHKVIGIIALLDMGHPQSVFEKFFVCKDYRRKNVGVGQQLLNTLLAWAKSQSIQAIYLVILYS
jgi:N-acetylglutamate synthase-like GNAT family acetyltransferase